MVEITGKKSDFLKLGVAAAGRGDLEEVRTILRQRPDWLTRIGSHGRTMLWEAAFRGRMDVVRFLVAGGANVDAWGCHFTPLLVEVSPFVAAKFKQHTEVAAFLEPEELDVFSAAFLGDEVALSAQIRKDPAAISNVKQQHDPSIKATALHYAVAGRSAATLEELLNAGADPVPHLLGLVRFAIWRDEPGLLDRLLLAVPSVPSGIEIPRAGIKSAAVGAVLARHGVLVDVDQAEGGWPALVFAARGDRGGDVARIQELLSAGANVDVVNAKRQTALHCAAKAGFVEIVEVLIEAGATVDCEDVAGDTPLASAIASTLRDREALASVVRLLVGAGADPDHPLAKGGTPRRRAELKRDGGKLSTALDG